MTAAPPRLGHAPWQSPHAHSVLAPGEVHVWRSLLGAANTAGTHALSPDEWLRAGRFVWSADRDRFIAARAFLRGVLGRYLGIAPRAVRFVYGQRDKPALAEARQLAFNLSHAGDWAVVAVADAGAVGIDVERVDGRVRPDEMGSVLTPAERLALAARPEADREAAFLALWTRKEAVVKACGSGLATPLDGVDVTCPPAGADCVFTPGWRTPCWWLAGVVPAPGYVGALAVDRPGTHVRYWTAAPQAL